MSTYEDYGETSASYDRTRVPIGTEIIVGSFARGVTPLAEQTVLDAGCGTGAYARELLPHVMRIEALDRSARMLAIAGDKLAEAEKAKRIAFHQAPLSELPFADASFDSIMVNQVLHHLDELGSETYPNLGEVVGGLIRVLRPGGVLLINTCTREQIRRGFWASVLIPDAVAKMSARYMAVSQIETLLGDLGLEVRGRFVPADAVAQGQAYFNRLGPLDKTWRDGDSIWANASAGELESALQTIRDLEERGELESFVAEHDAHRPHIGQVTFVLAQKP